MLSLLSAFPPPSAAMPSLPPFPPAHPGRFFEAFGPVTRARAGPGGCPFYFATDCGTLYAPYCIAELVRHMDRHPECEYWSRQALQATNLRVRYFYRGRVLARPFNRVPPLYPPHPTPTTILPIIYSGAAATGHQRIMDVRDQADPSDSTAEDWTGGLLRNVQVGQTASRCPSLLSTLLCCHRLLGEVLQYSTLQRIFYVFL